MHKHLKFVALAAAVLAAPLQEARAQYPSEFSGGSVMLNGSGTDGFGHTWLLNEVDGVVSFGMPGLGEGTTAFAGATPAFSLYLRFSLPGQATIDQSRPSSGSGFEYTWPGVRDAELNFKGVWNGASSVPEPTTMALLGLNSPASSSVAGSPSE